MGEAASLLRDRHFVKGLGHCPRMIIILLWPFDSHVHLQVLPGNRVPPRFPGPAYRILEKRTTSQFMYEHGKNLTHLQPVLLFQDSSGAVDDGGDGYSP